ncbi:MAG: 3'-5' exonuclease [Deltaproteobacteria bacterium]|nr:3'-5' exonuclease [Deltaproteobacteria bacterium]MBN2845164.1 3'-5' exonuclease [Deltaproteobacteria bacterium]
MFKSVFRYVALDVETTGLSPRKGHRIIEVGAVAIEYGKPVGELSSLVNSGRKIPCQTARIHGITDAMLTNQPLPDEIMPRLWDFLKDSIVIAHNARFDVEFLRHEFGLISLQLENKAVCTLEMSRKLYPGLPNHRLNTVYRYLFGEKPANVQRHRALDDAKMTAAIWLEMVKR